MINLLRVVAATLRKFGSKTSTDASKRSKGWKIPGDSRLPQYGVVPGKKERPKRRK